MSEFTTIRITKEVKNQLEVIKSTRGLKYNDIIKELLQIKAGEIVNDVITIEREQIALTLKYWEHHTDTIRVYDITYLILMNSKVGTVFAAEPSPNSNEDFVNSVAEIVYKKGDDVILLVKEINHVQGEWSTISSTVHVKLF